MWHACLLVGCSLAGALACCPAPRDSQPPDLVDSPRTERPLVASPAIGPSPLSRILHDQRVGATSKLEPQPAPKLESDVDRESDPDPESPLDPEPEFEAEEIREVVVRKKSPFATPEDLAAYAVRSMDHKPREYVPTRMLTRVSGLVGACSPEGDDRRRARQFTRQLVRRARPRLKACMVELFVEDPRVIMKAPSRFVFEQARRLKIPPTEVDLGLTITPEGFDVDRIEGRKGQLSTTARTCLEDAISGTQGTLPALTTSVRIEAPVVLFIQGAEGDTVGSLADHLSFQAAMIGWVHYEGGRFVEAREAFIDAAWAYRLPEFQVLIGMAEEKLGRATSAASAYQRFIESRPHAPEVEQLTERIATLAP